MSANIDLAAELGPGLIGAAVSYALAGLMLQQTIAYFCRFERDHLHHKIIAVFLELISLLSFSSTLAIQWRSVITLGEDPMLVIQPAAWYLNLPLALPICATAFSHLFFGIRAYVFAGRPRRLAAILATLWLSHIAVGFGTIAVNATPAGRGLGSGFVPQRTRDWATAALATGATADLVISAILVVFLDRLRTGFCASTDSLLTHFLRLTVTTGGITSSMTLLTAIVWGCSAKSARWQNLEMAFVFCMPQITGLCCIGTLMLRDPNRHARKISNSSSGSEALPSHRSQAFSVAREKTDPILDDILFRDSPFLSVQPESAPRMSFLSATLVASNASEPTTPLPIASLRSSSTASRSRGDYHCPHHPSKASNSANFSWLALSPK